MAGLGNPPKPNSAWLASYKHRKKIRKINKRSTSVSGSFFPDGPCVIYGRCARVRATCHIIWQHPEHFFLFRGIICRIGCFIQSQYTTWQWKACTAWVKSRCRARTISVYGVRSCSSKWKYVRYGEHPACICIPHAHSGHHIYHIDTGPRQTTLGESIKHPRSRNYAFEDASCTCTRTVWTKILRVSIVYLHHQCI